MNSHTGYQDMQPTETLYCGSLNSSLLIVIYIMNTPTNYKCKGQNKNHYDQETFGSFFFFLNKFNNKKKKYLKIF